MVEEPRIVQRNPKRALAHWRQMLDKVHMLQSLVGLEDSVNSWLPTASTEGQSSPPSSKQLAEAIAAAEPLAPQKTKVKPPKDFAQCLHPEKRLSTSQNQHAAWIVCWDCNARWKISKEFAGLKSKKEKSKFTPQTLASPSTPASSAETFRIEARAQESARAMYTEQMESMQQTAAASQSEVRQLRKELVSAVIQNNQITEIMMSEFAAMAMGASYLEHKGYHDSEMHAHATRRLENQNEINALTQLQQELADSPMRDEDRNKQPRTSLTG